MMEDVLLSFSIKKTCSLDMSLDLASNSFKFNKQ